MSNPVHAERYSARQHAADLLFVAGGGAVGALLRFGLNATAIFAPFPAVTLLENWLASLLLGGLVGWMTARFIAERVRLLLAVGLLGSFSTMSAFAADVFILAEKGAWFGAGLYIMLSLFGGITLSGAGYALGRRAGTRRGSGQEGGTIQ